MKTRLISQLFLVFGLGIIFITLQSNSTGKFENGTNCGSCHGNATTATTVLLNGLPASFVANQTYPLTFTVSNSIQPKAGFNIKASAGTFTAGTGSKTNGSKNQITHTAPMTAISGTSSFAFDWTAPATGTSVKFDFVGNAVNGDNNDGANDNWNGGSTTITQVWPSSVNDTETKTLRFYPNPTKDLLTVIGTDGTNTIFSLSNLSGQRMDVRFTAGKDRCTIDCSQYPAGLYILHVKINDYMQAFKFTVE